MISNILLNSSKIAHETPPKEIIDDSFFDNGTWTRGFSHYQNQELSKITEVPEKSETEDITLSKKYIMNLQKLNDYLIKYKEVEKVDEKWEKLRTRARALQFLF